ncbi:MAG: TetR/AcrR family transcriptional regulator [Acidimicrobiia bacterium]|nr:TetR/AcrR family transcriptional regulator [Acidimicrobiia bacterium]
MGARPSVGAGTGGSRAALLASATCLFAERGPGAVSAREIARHAGVNYALIHRHFGTKDGLLQAVLLELSSSLDDDLALPRHGDRAAALLADHEDLWRILAFLSLENQEWVTSHVGTHTGFQALSDVVRATESDAETARVRAGVGAAMVMGWVILRPFIDRLAELGDIDESKIQAVLNDSVQRVLLPPGSAIDLDVVDLTRSDRDGAAETDVAEGA